MRIARTDKYELGRLNGVPYKRHTHAQSELGKWCPTLSRQRERASAYRRVLSFDLGIVGGALLQRQDRDRSWNR